MKVYGEIALIYRNTLSVYMLIISWRLELLSKPLAASSKPNRALVKNWKLWNRTGDLSLLIEHQKEIDSDT